MEQVLAWLLVVIGAVGALGLGALWASGLVVEKVRWADTGTLVSAGTPLAASILLFLMGSITGTRSIVYLGFGLIFAFAIFVLIVWLPLLLMVPRTRTRKGWPINMTGKPPAEPYRTSASRERR